jgi:hypothetical protein
MKINTQVMILRLLLLTAVLRLWARRGLASATAPRTAPAGACATTRPAPGRHRPGARKRDWRVSREAYQRGQRAYGHWQRRLATVGSGA